METVYSELYSHQQQVDLLTRARELWIDSCNIKPHELYE